MGDHIPSEVEPFGDLVVPEPFAMGRLVSAHESAFAHPIKETDEVRYLRVLAELTPELRAGLLEAQFLPENDLVRLFDARDLGVVKSVALQADGVDACELCSIALDDRVRGDILDDDGRGRRHGETSHSRELVNTGEPAQVDVVLERHVASEGHGIGDDAGISHLAVVRHVAVGHEQASIPDSRHPATAFGADVDGRELAKLIAVADDELRFFTPILQILGNLAQASVWEDAVPLAQREVALEYGMRAHDIAGAHLDLGTDYREWANVAPCLDDRAAGNDCRCVNSHRFLRR